MSNSIVRARRGGGSARPSSMESVGRTSLSFERVPCAAPGWLLDREAERIMSGGYTPRNRRCRCGLLKAANGSCFCE